MFYQRSLVLAFALTMAIAPSRVSAQEVYPHSLTMGRQTGDSTIDFDQAYYENRPLSVRGVRFEEIEITAAGKNIETVTLTSHGHTTKLRARLDDDGTLTSDGQAACGALDAQNFVAKIIADAPTTIETNSSWKTSLPIQFTACDTKTIPVTVSVEQISGAVLIVEARGHEGHPIRYEGPSYWSIDILLHLIFIDGRFKQLDGTSDESLDWVKGHSVWTLAVRTRE
jgi:hypothetical protein